MKLLQICNVGQIAGGTGACAWTVCRALPEIEHVIWFRSQPTAETQIAFQDNQIEQGRRLEFSDIERLQPDLILLHNTPAAAVAWGQHAPQVRAVVIQYQHSQARHLAGCDHKVVCSEWLKGRLNNSKAGLLWQGVPQPINKNEQDDRSLSQRIKVGRICTPVAKKWPHSIRNFYAEVGKNKLPIEWEFVGCPEQMQLELRECLGGNVKFHASGWKARSHLHSWHVLMYSQPEVTESFGRVCAEAMRCGTVPVVDALGGFIEQMPEGTGFLCKDRSDFAAALQQLIDPAVWKTRSRACREWADSQFSIQAFRRRLLELMQMVSL